MWCTSTWHLPMCLLLTLHPPPLTYPPSIPQLGSSHLTSPYSWRADCSHSRPLAFLCMQLSSPHGQRARVTPPSGLHPNVTSMASLPWSVQFSSVAQLCPTLCNSMDCSTPGLPVHHQLPRFTQTHVHWVSDAIQPSRPLSSPSPPTFSLSQHQGLFQWVSSLHQVAKVLEFQLQHQFFQWIFRTDFL